MLPKMHMLETPRPWPTVKSCKVELAETRMALAAGGPRSQPEGGAELAKRQEGWHWSAQAREQEE